MELVILKDNKIFARATADEGTMTDYRMEVFETVPEYPSEKPPKGKRWELEYDNGELIWVLADRPLTIEERMDELEQKEFEWRAGEAVKVGYRRYYNEKWYICLQAHTTQADWMPDIVPALWKCE